MQSLLGALLLLPCAFSLYGGIWAGLGDLQNRCATSELRRRFLEDIVIDNKRVEWVACEQAFAFSLKNDDRDWVLGLMDSALAKLVAGYYSKPVPPMSHEALAEEFSNEIQEALEVSADDFDQVATSLMITRARETVEDELYDQGIEDHEFVFGDDALNISPATDKRRREVIFKALCALRFVRLGLKAD
jgi:hypothetical protein